MRVNMKEIKINSEKRKQFINITSNIRKIVDESGNGEGNCFVYCPHTTAAITINEGADPAVQEDIMRALDEIIPKIEFRHMEGNSDAHIKSSLIGPSETIPVENGSLKLGTWQKIFFCEFDGPRPRKFWVQINE